MTFLKMFYESYIFIIPGKVGIVTIGDGRLNRIKTILVSIFNSVRP